ncbi:MAG: hydrogenase maturation nickel metallochaperone HypA [Bdellovibrionales bacterium GWA2_49_15]|nr:MAG: hydrogenase maturation nickel metallochaperone HypA [Bdellovibrionales bacterium GWA2_49_15]HAZ14208.1 hydrogenase maturation nickel metallochaperone HypA [Bdellovibrionales bacterium]
MHELSLSVSLIEQATEILKQESGGRVLALTLDVGVLSGVSPEALQFCFPQAAHGTALEKCLLKINEIPLLVYCSDCQAEEQVEGPYPLCPSCQGVDVAVRKGREFNIVSMEIE